MFLYEAVDNLIASGRWISTMESCTGGLLASVITDRSGASDIFKGGFVTYSNEAKVQQGVSHGVIDTYGVYSIETAEAMACACAKAYGAEIGVGVTGSLGRKDPHNADSSVGTVFYSIFINGAFYSKQIAVPGNLQMRKKMKEWVVNRILEDLDGLLRSL